MTRFCNIKASKLVRKHFWNYCDLTQTSLNYRRIKMVPMGWIKIATNLINNPKAQVPLSCFAIALLLHPPLMGLFIIRWRLSDDVHCTYYTFMRFDVKWIRRELKVDSSSSLSPLFFFLFQFIMEISLLHINWSQVWLSSWLQ